MINSLESAYVILVVDDDPAVRKVVRGMLERLGYTVLQAEDGDQALALCEALGTNPDLIISDIRMPQVSGGELVRELERSGAKPRVLLMSGHADEALKAELNVGGYPFIKKPFTFDELAAKVREAMKNGLAV
jgi:CheY-like chemotaxis protein